MIYIVLLEIIIEQSFTPVVDSIRTPGTGALTTLNNISRAGGVLNAHEAVRLASTIKGERKISAGNKNDSSPLQKPITQPKKSKGF